MNIDLVAPYPTRCVVSLRSLITRSTLTSETCPQQTDNTGWDSLWKTTTHQDTEQCEGNIAHRLALSI